MFNLIRTSKEGKTKIYEFEDENDHKLRVTYRDNPEPMSKTHIVFNNSGDPTYGQMTFSYYCDRLALETERPFTCQFEDIDKLQEQLRDYKELGEEILTIIKKVEEENGKHIS